MSLMTIQRGSSGEYVQLIQQRLSELKLYTGIIDSSFGGGTEAGIKNFQIQQKLTPTGVVDSATWALLFPGQPLPQPALASAPVSERCLALTGSFETGNQPPDCFCRVTGDFDGMGISFGALQWNLGQKTLQPLLQQVIEQHGDLCQSIFHENLDTIKALGTASLEEQLTFARSIQARASLNEPWHGMFVTLGRTPEFRAIQVVAAAEKYRLADGMCGTFGLTSQRAIALMFDIATQTGLIGPIVKSQIMGDFAQLPKASAADTEVNRMRIVANRVAASAKPQYVDDVRTRKLTVANGTGTVHGITYDLEGTFCLTLDPYADQASSANPGNDLWGRAVPCGGLVARFRLAQTAGFLEAAPVHQRGLPVRLHHRIRFAPFEVRPKPSLGAGVDKEVDGLLRLRILEPVVAKGRVPTQVETLARAVAGPRIKQENGESARIDGQPCLRRRLIVADAVVVGARRVADHHRRTRVFVGRHHALVEVIDVRRGGLRHQHVPA